MNSIPNLELIPNSLGHMILDDEQIVQVSSILNYEVELVGLNKIYNLTFESTHFVEISHLILIEIYAELRRLGEQRRNSQNSVEDRLHGRQSACEPVHQRLVQTDFKFKQKSIID